MGNRVASVLATLVVPLWPVTIVGAALGAIVGMLVLTSSATYSAASVISVEVPISTNQLMTGMQPFSESLPDYLGGELIYLNSEGFTRAVAKKLDRSSPPSISTTRSGKADLFTLEASADSPNDAVQVVEAAVTAYMEHVRQDNTKRYQDAVAAVDAVITQMQQNLPTTTVDASASGSVPPPAELTALYTQRAALQVQLGRAPGVIVVDPAVLAVTQARPPLGAVVGSALGGLLALGAALLWRSRSGILSSRKQIGDQVAPCPVILLGKAELDTTIARSIYAVLPTPRTGRIVVVGVSPNSEARKVADYISFAASEHGPVEEVDLVTGETGSPTIDAADGTVVVNAGVWASSPAATDAIDHATQVIVVARLRFDTRQAVAELCEAASQRSAPFCVVCAKGGS